MVAKLDLKSRRPVSLIGSTESYYFDDNIRFCCFLRTVMDCDTDF